jgi:hypothetical protein
MQKIRQDRSFVGPGHFKPETAVGAAAKGSCFLYFAADRAI